MASHFQQINFDDTDYVTLNNGKKWLGKPLGWEVLVLITLGIIQINYLFYFLVPLKRSHKTLDELFGLQTFIVITFIMILLIIITMFAALKDKNEDYVVGKKNVFTATLSSFEIKKDGF